MSDSSYQDVLARVRIYYARPDEDVSGFNIWYPRHALASETPGACEPSGNPVPRYNGQVLRAVNELVAEGTLVKTGEGRDALYWTPAARAKSLAGEEQAAVAQAAKRKRWQRVKEGLADRGFPDTSHGEAGVRLALESWEILLGRLDLAPSGVFCVTCGDTCKIVQIYEDVTAEPWRPGSYAEGVVRPCPACSAGLEVTP